MNHIFNNKVFIEPSTDAVVNFDSSPAVASLGSSTVLILGESTRGLDYSDKKVYEFTSVSDARNALQSGSGVDLCQLAFAPSGQTAGASKVLFVKTNTGSVATAKFASTAQVSSGSYAIAINTGKTVTDVRGQIGFTLTVNGKTKKFVQDIIYLADGSGLANALVNLTAQLNTEVGVTAVLTAATRTIAVSGVDAAVTINMTAAIQPSACTATITMQAVTPTLLNTTIKTLEKGADLQYSVKATNGVVTFYKGSDAKPASGGAVPFSVLGAIEGVTSVSSLKTLVAEHPVLSKLFVVDVPSGSESETITTAGVVPFYVAADTATTTTTFSTALTLSAKYDKTAVITDQTSEVYHLLLSNYVMSESEYACHAFIGREAGLTPSEIMTYAATFNSENVVLCYPCVYLNFTGETKLYPSSYFAAMCAGVAAGLPCQDPLTRKAVSALGFEDIDYEGQSEKSTRESMINHGVLFGWYTDANGYNILKGINTIQNQNVRSILGTDNRTHEISISRIRHQMQKELRVSADAVFPGTTRLKPNATDVANFLANYLNSKVGTYLQSWDDKSLSVTFKDDAWYAEAGCTVNGPVNFAFFTLNFTL